MSVELRLFPSPPDQNSRRQLCQNQFLIIFDIHLNSLGKRIISGWRPSIFLRMRCVRPLLYPEIRFELSSFLLFCQLVRYLTAANR